jgi:hypothetical protein
LVKPIGNLNSLDASLASPETDTLTPGPGETNDVHSAGLSIDDEALAHLRRLNPALASDPGWIGMRGRLPARACISGPSSPPARTMETAWTRGYGRNVSRQNLYNNELAAAQRNWVRLDPLVLKSMLAQESSFRPRVVNVYGYAGIAQLGIREARFTGLDTGRSRMRRSGAAAYVDRIHDERMQPARAIPAAATLLRAKDATLERGLITRRSRTRLDGFAALGRPSGDDYWRFMAAAYNGGEGTILWAMHYAYGNTPPAAVRWNDLLRGEDGGVRSSPLYRAIRKVGMNPDHKYREISEYADQVLKRARQ